MCPPRTRLRTLAHDHCSPRHGYQQKVFTGAVGLCPFVSACLWATARYFADSHTPHVMLTYFALAWPLLLLFFNPEQRRGNGGFQSAGSPVALALPAGGGTAMAAGAMVPAAPQQFGAYGGAGGGAPVTDPAILARLQVRAPARRALSLSLPPPPILCCPFAR